MLELLIGILIGHILIDVYFVKRKKELKVEKWIKSKLNKRKRG